jgi:hypothetical protein
MLSGMTHHDLPEGQKIVGTTLATLRKLTDKWWGQTVDDFRRHWSKYHGKWVAFECYFGCICVSKDPKRALRVAKKQGFGEPHLYLYDVSSAKVYLPDGKEYDPHTDDLHTEGDGADNEDVRLVN